MKIKTFIILLLYSFIKVFAQTAVTVKSFPINNSPNPTVVMYDYVTGASNSFWNDTDSQTFIIPMGENLLSNIIIFDQDTGGKSLFIRNGDHIIYDYSTKEISSLKHSYLQNDLRLTTISRSENCEEYIIDRSVSSDFAEVVRLQNTISDIKFEDIPNEFPKGLPLYRIKLYEYLNSKYILSTKRTPGNNLYFDYLKHFGTIYKDPLISKETLSSYVFTKLNLMGTGTTEEDFRNAFSIFKNNTNDLNALEYIENEYFLADKLNSKSKVGIIDGEKKQVQYEHLIKQNRGKYIVVDFWASWCVPCLTSIPKSLELKKQYPNDLAVLYISLDRTFNPWKNAENRFQISPKSSYLVVNGMQKDLAIENINITTIPRYFIYDMKGNLVNSSLEDITEVSNFIKRIHK